MYRNIIICGVAVIILSAVGLFLSSWTYHDRFNPLPVIGDEPQTCSVGAECEMFNGHCGSNWPIAVSKNNIDRYQNLLVRHCEENPPKEILHLAVNARAVCVKSKCELMRNAISP